MCLVITSEEPCCPFCPRLSKLYSSGVRTFNEFVTLSGFCEGPPALKSCRRVSKNSFVNECVFVYKHLFIYLTIFFLFIIIIIPPLAIDPHSVIVDSSQIMCPQTKIQPSFFFISNQLLIMFTLLSAVIYIFF